MSEPTNSPRPRGGVHKNGLESYNFLVSHDQSNVDNDIPAGASQEAMDYNQQEESFANSLEERAKAINACEDETQEGRCVNQFGEMARAESCVLFGVVDEVEEKNERTGNSAITATVNEASKEGTSDHSKNDEVLNQFGTISSRPSCILFGVEDDVAEVTRQVASSVVSSNHPVDDSLVEEQQGEQILVNFGDDEETKDGKPKGKGRYINQFGEIARSTSYKMLRGGTGSVNSLTSLNQFGGSELGSSLGSVCELSALQDDTKNDGNETGSGFDTKHAPVTEVVNQVRLS